MSKTVVLCGVGGQGTVLASRVLASAAMAKDMKVMSAETIGMAQRGGSVQSYLCIGDDAKTPMIGKDSADLIIGFEPGETVRMLPYLKEGGTVVVSKKAIKPTTVTLNDAVYEGSDMISYLEKKVDKLFTVDGEAATEALGNPKTLNMVLLGVAVRNSDIGITEDEALDAIKSSVKEKFVELNIKAFNYYR